MIAQSAKSRFRWSTFAIVGLAIHVMNFDEQAKAINILVDYRYDTGNFFNTQQKKDALAAAAARYSAIITTSLSAATLSDNSLDPRIRFTHPGSGADFQVSAANSTGSDAIVFAGQPAANEYRGAWSIPANTWILYAGGRPLSESGQGGTATGINFPSVFTDGSSHLNRGFRATGIGNNLPVWGGAISFDSDGSTIWHYDLNTPAPGLATDFYSIALHEIGHALGLSSTWNEWANFSSGGRFSGTRAVAAYNADNGASISTLAEVSSSNHHWQDGTYDSYIFQNASPKYTGTVGPGFLQDLLMEPSIDFIGTLRRFEITNVDVAALRDVGWTVVPTINGDYNVDGTINAADYVLWRRNIKTLAAYTAWRSNFGRTTSGAGSGAGAAFAVPEPSTLMLLGIGAISLLGYRKAKSHG